MAYWVAWKDSMHFEILWRTRQWSHGMIVSNKPYRHMLERTISDTRFWPRKSIYCTSSNKSRKKKQLMDHSKTARSKMKFWNERTVYTALAGTWKLDPALLWSLSESKHCFCISQTSPKLADNVDVELIKTTSSKCAIRREMLGVLLKRCSVFDSVYSDDLKWRNSVPNVHYG